MSWTNLDLVEVRALQDGGRGVFSRKKIAKDSVIAVFDGRAVRLRILPDGKVDYGREDPHMLIHLAAEGDTFYALAPIAPDDVRGVDFMNHSCQANCYIERTLVVRAKTDIPAGVELTWDYRDSDLIPQGIPCWCPDPKCVL
ncbi:MAG: SET domain-containing protein [Alphaproteobacteria bacterium]